MRRALFADPRRTSRVRSRKESIIVAGDGEAVVLVDEEEKIREMGWNVAMSKPTLVQLATCAATGVAEPLLGTCDAY